MTHTPGPWHRGSDFNDNRFVIFPETGRMRLEPGQGTVLYSIAKVVDSFSEDEDDANARLIAAAPDLLKALEGLMQEATGYLSDLSRHQVDATTLTGAIKIARRAIKKVQGE